MKLSRLLLTALGGRPPSSLLTGLTAYWKLDEASDGSGAVSRLDSGPNAQNLTDTNTTASGIGKIGNCCDFENSNTEYLSIADNAIMSVADIDFCFDFWINPEALANNRNVLGKGTGSSANLYQYQVYSGVAGIVYWVVSYSTDRNFVNTAAGAVVVGTWAYIYVYHDATKNEIGISINGATPIVAPAPGGCYDGTGEFYLGAGPNAAFPYDGLIDEVGYWRGRILTPAEIAKRYNGGNGSTYPAFAGSGTPFTEFYGTFLYSSSIEA